MNELCPICGGTIVIIDGEQPEESQLCHCDDTLTNDDLRSKISEVLGVEIDILSSLPASYFLEEVAALHDKGWEIQAECSSFDGLDKWAWRVWIMRFTRKVEDMRCYQGTAQTLIRAVYLSYLRYRLGAKQDKE